MKDNLSCEVVFEAIIYGDQTPTIRREWQETYDGSVTEVDLDLSSLAGSCVIVDLIVRSNTLDVENANALWLEPEVIKAK